MTWLAVKTHVENGRRTEGGCWWDKSRIVLSVANQSSLAYSESYLQASAFPKACYSMAHIIMICITMPPKISFRLANAAIRACDWH